MFVGSVVPDNLSQQKTIQHKEDRYQWAGIY